MSEPTTAAGRKMLGVLDSLMAVLHGIATADLPENIAAHAKTTDQVKEELAALVLAIEAEAAAPAPLDVERLAEAIDKHRMPLLICDDCGDESRNPECRSCGGRMHLATPAPLDEQPLFDRIRELNAEVALLKKEAREDRAELRVDLAATPAPLDVERLARAIDAIEARHVREGRGDRLTTRDNDELAVAIAAAYAEETP
jgi:hypothetical protein